MNREDLPLKYLRLAVIAIIFVLGGLYAVIAIILVLGGLYWIVGEVGLQIASIAIPGFLQVASVAISGLLTLALVVLYYQQYSVQSKQTDILDSQKALMRLQDLPDLTITSWDFEENTLQFTLANLGKGIAKNISVDIRILPQTIDYYEDFDSHPKPLYQANEDTQKSFLRGKETLPFVGPATATTVVGNVQDWEFTRVVNHLCSKGEEQIEFVVELQYANSFGETTRIPVTSRLTEIHEDMTFEEAITDADVTNTVVRHVPHDAELERFDVSDERGIFFDPREKS